MEYQKYIEQKKELSAIFHQFFERVNSSREDFQNFITFFETPKYKENKDEFKLINCMINKTSNHHHRYPVLENFFQLPIDQFEPRKPKNRLPTRKRVPMIPLLKPPT